MEKPDKNTSSAAYLEHSAFTTSGVGADPETTGMEAPLLLRHNELKQHTRNLVDLQEEIQRKRAILVVCDHKGDGIIRSFELYLYDLVKKNRDNPLYRRYFKDGLRDITEANMRTEQPQKVAAMLKCFDEDETTPELQDLVAKFKAPLKAAAAEVKTAESALANVEEQTLHLREKTIPATEAAWTDEYVKLHAELKAKFPRDPARAESYFYPFRKAKKKEDGEK